MSDVPALDAVVAKAAEGLSAATIARDLSMVEPAVNRWLAKPETQRAIAALVSFHRSIVDRYTEREVARVVAHAAAVARGEADVPTDQAMQLIWYFLTWGQVAPPTTKHALDAHAQVVHVHLDEKWRPELPRVIDG